MTAPASTGYTVERCVTHVVCACGVSRDFTARTFSDARQDARRAGWKVRIGRTADSVACPSCRTRKVSR